MKTYRVIKKIVDLLLIVFIAVYIITGFGITNHRIIEAFTFSALSKPVSHLIHTYLIIPFLILLILHIFLNKLYFVKKLIRRAITSNNH